MVADGRAAVGVSSALRLWDPKRPESAELGYEDAFPAFCVRGTQPRLRSIFTLELQIGIYL